MPDIAKAKRNVAKMVSMNAPEADIDAYIASEGLTIEAIRSFRENRVDPGELPETEAGQTYQSKLHARNAMGQLAQPFITYQSAKNELGKGNIGVGGLRAARVIPQAVGGFFGAGIEGLKATGGGRGGLAPLGNALETAATPITAASDFLNEYANKPAHQLARDILPNSLGPTITEHEKLTEEVTPFAVGAAAGGALKGIKGKIAARPLEFERRGNIGFQRVATPLTKELSRPDDLSRMAGYVAEEQRKAPVKLGDKKVKGGRSLKDVSENRGGTHPSVVRQIASEKFPNIKQRIYREQDYVINKFGDQPMVGQGQAIATNIESLSNVYTKWIDVLKDKSIFDEAAKYRELGVINLRQGQSLLKHLNANLQEFYKKANESQAAAENMAKPIAEMEKAAGSLRDQIAKTIEDVSSPEAAKWYKGKSLDYGAAARLEAAFERNVAKAGTPAQPFLTEKTSGIYPSRAGETRAVLQHTIGKHYTVEKIAERAMKDYAKSKLKAPEALNPSRKPVKGLLGTGAIRVGPSTVGDKVSVAQDSFPGRKIVRGGPQPPQKGPDISLGKIENPTTKFRTTDKPNPQLDFFQKMDSLKPLLKAERAELIARKEGFLIIKVGRELMKVPENMPNDVILQKIRLFRSGQQ